MTDLTRPRITRVVLENWKSIASCDVRLGDLTFLVGPNGAGKSNFLDALSFLCEALATTLDRAVLRRGNAYELLRRASGTDSFGLRVEFAIPPKYSGHYAVRVEVRSFGQHLVRDEECVVEGEDARHFFRSSPAGVATSASVPPAVSPDRLLLVSASGLPEFRPVFDLLADLHVYNIDPSEMRVFARAGSGRTLSSDGANTAVILNKMSDEIRVRVSEYLSHVVPGLQGVTAEVIAGQGAPSRPQRSYMSDRLSALGETYVALQFQQKVDASEDGMSFSAMSMSEGTLRALGVLIALLQDEGVPVVGIEEPEAAIHPGALGALLDAMREAANSRQVIVASQSPDLLDDKDVNAEDILAVVTTDGATRIGPIDEVGRSVLRDRLFTAGEMMRMDQLSPEPSDGGPPQLFDITS